MCFDGDTKPNAILLCERKAGINQDLSTSVCWISTVSPTGCILPVLTGKESKKTNPLLPGRARLVAVAPKRYLGIQW